MFKINLYTNDGNKTLEFNFQFPGFAYIEEKDWVTISATGRTFTIKDLPFLAYDETIKSAIILNDFMNLSRSQINEAYNNKGKILMIFSPSGEPIKMFYGEKMSLVKEIGSLNYFQVDGKDIYFYKMSYLILTKN